MLITAGILSGNTSQRSDLVFTSFNSKSTNNFEQLSRVRYPFKAINQHTGEKRGSK